MLNLYINTMDVLERLRTDKAGVVSFEYVIVAACVVGAVVARSVLAPPVPSARR